LTSVHADGDRAFVADRLDDDVVNNGGAVYVLERDQGGPDA
jgi:hypothetical protein